MPSLVDRISSFARSAKGREYSRKAQDYAQSEKGRRQIDGLRKRFARKK